MKSFLLFLLFVVTSTSALFAGQVFILLEGDCFERVRYEQAIASQPRTDYYAYHFRLPGNQRLMLETGVETNTLQNYIPNGTLVCNDPRLGEALIDQVGNGTDQVYLLRPALNGQYQLHPVVRAAYMNQENNELTYRSRLASFKLHTIYGVIGENISYQNPSATVVFEGREQSACSGTYLFQQTDPQNAYPIIHYRISPELGLMERRLGSNGTTSEGGVVVARAVEGVPVLNYLAANCERLRSPVAAPAVAQTSSQPTYPTTGSGQQPQILRLPQTGSTPATYGNQPAVQPESRAALGNRGGISTPAAPMAATVNTNSRPLTHTVTKGETLWSISQRYKEPVAELRTLNNLSSNTIYPGQQLTIRAGAIAPAAPRATTAAPTTGAAPSVYAGPVAAGPNQHVVQPGETAASLALRYGYTERRFREFNNLSQEGPLLIGQTLLTDHCNCAPAYTPAPVGSAPAPSVYNTTPAAPQPYRAPAAAPQQTVPTTTNQPITLPTSPYGDPRPDAAPTTYSAPATSPAPAYQPPRTYPQPYTQPQTGSYTPKGVTAPTTQLPNYPSAPPARTMTQLESRPAPVTYGNQQQLSNPNVGTPMTGGAPSAAPTNGGATAPLQSPFNRSVHIVQEGDSIYTIAQRYGISTAELRRLNHLQPSETIVPFQKLYVN